MMHGGKTWFSCALGSLLLVSGAPGNTATSPYDSIVERNVFGLKPLPPPVRPEDIKQPAPDIILTGITTILGNKRALLKVPAKPPARPKEESFILTEGQSEGDIEVINIDEVAATVKVKNHGLVQTLDFTDNGIRAPGGGAPGAPFGRQSMPAGMMIQPPSAGGFKQIPPRPMRAAYSPVNEQSQSSGNQSSGNSSYPSMGSTAPGYSNPGYGSPQTDQTSTLSIGQHNTGFTSTPDYGMTADEQTLLIEANRAKLLEEGRGDEAAMLPPTDLTPSDGQQLLPQ